MTACAPQQGDGPVTHLSTPQHRRLAELGLYLNLPEPAIICTACGFALKADSDRVSRRLGEKHGVSKSARWGLNSLIYSLNLPDPGELPPRPDRSSPHPHLALQEGLACKHCGLRSISNKVMVEHVKKAHRSEMGLAARYNRKAWVRDHIDEKLLFQSWGARDIRRSWIVQRDRSQQVGQAADGPMPLEAAPVSVQAFAEQLQSEERQHIDQPSSCHLKPADGSTSTASLLANWMRRTGWERIFEGHGGARKEILVLLSELPTSAGHSLHLGDHDGQALESSADDERKLALTVVALDRLFDRCGDTVQHTDVSLRRWLRSIIPWRAFKAPFELVTRLSSERAYRNEYKRCLCFWLRLWRLPRAMAKLITRRGFSRPQAMALTQLWDDQVWEMEEPTMGCHATEYIGDEPGILYDSGDEDEDDEDDEEQEEEGEDQYYDGENLPDNPIWPSDDGEAMVHDPAADIILQLLHFMATEDFEDGRSSSALLVYFSAVRGLSGLRGDEFLRPGQFTPILAKLIYCTRLVILEATLPRFPHNYISLDARPRYGQLEIMDSVRISKMCDGTPSPIGEFLSLMACGRAQSRSEGPSYHFEWSKDGNEISWDNCHSLSMNSFSGIRREALRLATQCYKRLMYDWEPSEPITLASIRDRLSTTTLGYSFLSDPANSLTDSYLPLFMKACLSPLDGFLKPKSQTEGQWNTKAVQAYLATHDDFLKVVMSYILTVAKEAESRSS